MNRSPKIFFTEDVRKAPETDTVCYCSQVTKVDILRAKKEGARSLAEIKTATSACTQKRAAGKPAPEGADARG